MCIVFIVHVSLAILLFFSVNWIGAKSISIGYITMGLEVRDDETPAFNFLLRVLSPVVYIILVGVILQNLNADKYISNIYLITIYYWIIRLFYVIFTNRILLTNWTRQLVYWSISISLSIWIAKIIQKVDTILPDPKTLLDQFWILVILFLYSICNKIQLSNQSSTKRKQQYIKARYKKLSSIYKTDITNFFHDKFYETITYSIMIYEEYNRPRIIRWIEYINFWITQKEHSLGIMQVKTTHYINDRESLNLAMKKIKNDSELILQNSDNNSYYYDDLLYFVSKIASKYNNGYDYSSEILFIYTYLTELQNIKQEIPKTLEKYKNTHSYSPITEI